MGKSIFYLLFLMPTLVSLDHLSAQISGFTIEAVAKNDIDAVIRSIPDSVEVVGLGESSHFTKEYYEYRTSIIEELIAGDFKLLLFEVDYGTAAEWNDYIQTGEGDIGEILKNCPWWTYSTVEFKKLLEELRNYNSGVSIQQRVSIFGIEMTYTEGIFDLLRNIVNLYYTADDQQSVNDFLGKERNYLAFSEFSNQEIADYLEVRSIIQKINNEIANKDNVPDVVKQEITMIENIMSQFISYISLDNQALKTRLRDQFSFNNYEYLRYFNNNTKTIIWAHTGHLEKQYSYIQLGSLLDHSLDNKYFNFTFDYGSGENGTRQPGKGLSPVKFKRQEGSLTDELYNLGPSDYFINIRTSKRMTGSDNYVFIMNTLNEYTDVARYNPYRQINLFESADGLIFIRETHLPTVL